MHRSVLKYFRFLTLSISMVLATIAQINANSNKITALVIGKGNTDYPPYHWTDEKGQLQGICPDIIHQACESIGITKITYICYPWSRMLANAKFGKVDAVMPLFRNEEREGFLDFPDNPLIWESTAFLTLPDSAINFSGEMKTLLPFTIGVVKNYFYGKQFEMADFHKDYSINDEMLMTKLKAKRFPVAIGSPLVMQYFASKKGFTLRILTPYISEDGLYMGFSKSKGYGKIANNFSKAIQQLKDQGKYQQIINKYKYAP
jgi:polar amino acid transport system substrate-binding protein